MSDLCLKKPEPITSLWGRARSRPESSWAFSYQAKNRKSASVCIIFISLSFLKFYFIVELGFKSWVIGFKTINIHLVD